jgi:hypothetical protein
MIRVVWHAVSFRNGPLSRLEELIRKPGVWHVEVNGSVLRYPLESVPHVIQGDQQ